MKWIAVIWWLGLLSTTSTVPPNEYPADSLLLYFRQVEEATLLHKNIWNKDIYGPILVVDPTSREVYANMPDGEGRLTAHEGVYRGQLSKDIIPSNTDVRWSGTHWAMVTLPLPIQMHDRVDLITHELFHVAQPSLGFVLQREENNHLDIREGRIYLRLEMAALERALRAQRLASAEEHLRNALLFRKYRLLLYRGAETTENSLELLEGIATYTGQLMSGRNKWEWREYLIRRLEHFKEVPSFVRTFAYETVPVYVFFLYQKDNNWNREMDDDTSLTELFSKAFGVDKRILLQSYVKQVAVDYGGRSIAEQETQRELVHDIVLERYREKFLEEPHLEIRLEEMSMAFDMQELVPLDEDEGTVYPTITVSDRWGVLSVVKEGALLRRDWRWMIVSEPLLIDSTTVVGEGWNITLNEGYEVIRRGKGDYQLISAKSVSVPPANGAE